MNDKLSQMMNNEVYLGDGLYVTWDGWGIKLRDRQEGPGHFIYLEPKTLSAFEDFVENLRKEIGHDRQP